MENGPQAIAHLAQAAAAQLHLSGAILTVLIERGLLSPQEAVAIVGEAKDRVSSANPALALFGQLKNEFPG